MQVLILESKCYITNIGISYEDLCIIFCGIEGGISNTCISNTWIKVSKDANVLKIGNI